MPVLKNLSMSAYNDIVALRSSDLKTFVMSPAHYKYSKSVSKDEIPALAIGSAVHTRILEPDKFDSEYGIYRAHKTRCQAFYIAAKATPGKILLLESEADMVRRIADSVHSKKHVMDLLKDCEPELSITGTVEGVFCKCRCDAFNPNNNRVLDLKTTGKSASQFKKAIWEFGYHYSNAFYNMVLESNGIFVKDFVFVVIEKDAPYEVRLVTIDKEWVDMAKKEIELMLPRFLECLKTNIWPGYSTEIEELKLRKE